VTVGAALPLIWSSPSVAFLSAFLFGSSFLAVAAAVTSCARGDAPPHYWTAAIGTLTAAFGVGQCAGPVLSGALSDGPDGVRLGLWQLRAAEMASAIDENRPTAQLCRES
jgi:Uncharacterised MFS-type transporter YbfB